MGKAATAIMMITAGAHSSQPEPALGPRALRQPLAVSASGSGLAGGDGFGRRHRLYLLCVPLGGWPAGLGAHGITPFESSALLISPAIAFSVLGGSMLAGGDTAWEITMETFWYAGVCGRTLAFCSEVRISAWNG